MTAVEKLQEQLSARQLSDYIIESILDAKGSEIVQLDLTGIQEAPADFFIICQGQSTTQVKSIAQKVQKQLKDEFGLYPNHVEGEKESQWVLVDFFDVVLHIFHPTTREFYELEELWSDAEISKIDQ